LYAPFGLVPFPAGNTGVQMAGWFRKPVNSLADLKGLKMRIPGLGGAAVARVGATPVNLPGAESFSSLQSGAIDAAEWVGPYDDLAFGLRRAAKYCYYPGRPEPGPPLECMVNRAAWAALPQDLKDIVDACCRAVNDSMLAEYTARNQQALDALVREHGVELRQLPDDVMAALRRASQDVLEEVAAADPLAKRVLESMRAFEAQAQAWHAVSEVAYYATRH